MSPNESEHVETNNASSASVDSDAIDTRLLTLVGVATLLSLAHHVDHVIRGNHVGWPVTASVNVFTVSLAVYPVIGFGLVQTLRGRAGTRYWFGVSTAGLCLLGVIHFGPFAVEPPSDILGPYAPSPVGYVALAILVGLLVALCGVVVTAATRELGN